MSKISKRKNLRLKGYDYSSPNVYFITICSFDRKNLFGHIFNGVMRLNENGNIVRNEWLRTTIARDNVKLDKFVIMPNHIHGIVIINGKSSRGVLQYAPTNRLRSPSQTIGAIIRGFKSTTTKQINILRKTPKKPIWQRNYYEHIIRNEKDLNEICEYIINNPQKWDLDKENLGTLTP